MNPSVPRAKRVQAPMPGPSAEPPPVSLRPGRKLFIERCEMLRFRGDRRRRASADERLEARAGVEEKRSMLLGNCLRVDRNNAPEVFALVESCATRLGLATLPEVFVSDEPANAYCHSAGPDDHGLLHLSGCLFDLLSDEEIASIICHELGHLALHGAGTPIGAQSRMTPLQRSAMQQASEISADRVGLVGCGSFDAAARALVKLHCGFGRIASKIDIPALMSQAADIDAQFNAWQATTSHPFLPVRLWALSQFHEAMSGKSIDELLSPEGGHALARVDDAVSRRLDMMGGGQAPIERARSFSTAQVWLGVIWLASLSDTARSRGEAELRKECGEVEIDTALKVLADCGSDEITVRAGMAIRMAVISCPNGSRDLLAFIDDLSARCGVNVKATDAWVMLDELTERVDAD